MDKQTLAAVLQATHDNTDRNTDIEMTPLARHGRQAALDMAHSMYLTDIMTIQNNLIVNAIKLVMADAIAEAATMLFEMLADNDTASAKHEHVWSYSIHDAARYCACGVTQSTPVEADVDREVSNAD